MEPVILDRFVGESLSSLRMIADGSLKSSTLLRRLATLTAPEPEKPPAFRPVLDRTRSSQASLLLGFHQDTKRMQIESLHPGVSVEQVQAETEFELGCCDEVGVTVPPTNEQLGILRNEVDPHRYIIGR